MIVRSAVLEGAVASTNRTMFDAHMAGPVLSAIARYPGLLEVRLRRPAETEKGAPAIYAIFDFYFEDLEAMREALASEVRQAVRQEIASIMSMFEGRVYHLVLEERTSLKGRP